MSIQSKVNPPSGIEKPDVLPDMLRSLGADFANRQNEQEFRDFAESIVQHVDEVFFWRNPDSLKPHFISQAYERIWGQPCHSAYAEPSSWIESIHPEDRDRVIQEFEHAGAGGQTQVEYRIVRPDGEVRSIWTRMFPVSSETGELTRLVGIAQDCTERKQAEKMQAFLASLVASSDDSIIGTDLDAIIMSWNQGSERLFGYRAEEVIGKEISILFPSDPEGDRVDSIHRKVRRRERIERFESVRMAKDGTTREVSVILSPVRNTAGDLQGVSAVYRDISANKRADAELIKAKEAAEAASQAKSTFLATMSHEIRTPMNGILGMTELVLDSDLTEDQRDSLDLVRLSAESLLSVINDILDFSKIEAGKMEFESIPFDLRESLGETMKTLGFRAHQKGLELVCDVRPDVPLGVLGDPGRLRQILVNLVGNAIKFTEQGEILVSVERESSTDDTVCLHFSVKDTGVGIPAEKHEKIFESFSQADGSMTRKYGGTGLGLTISGKLIEIMGGRLWVESQEGLGSTFHFTANLGVQIQAAEPAAPLHHVHLRDLPVLIVDDNSTNRRVLMEILTRWGMKPTAVEGGRAAFLALQIANDMGRPFRLILLDGQMPEMDGFTFAQQLKGRPNLVRTTIMMLTSADQLGDATLCRKLGISAYLVKPVRQSELLDMIRRSLQEQGTGQVLTVRPVPLDVPANQTRVLVAEDNAVNQTLARRLLEKRGYAVTLVADGQAALEAFTSQPFDLVLMDVQMPIMDGFEASAAIRRHEQSTGTHIPIVAITAHAIKGDQDRCLAAGMDAYVAKPIRAEELYGAIERMLSTPLVTSPV